MGLQEPWFSFVKNGIKTIEGRIYDDKRKLLKIGDMIEFSCEKKKIKKEIKNLKIFSNFEEALKYGKLKNILPGIKTYKSGVELYRSISGYKKKEKKYGVLLIFLENK